MLSRIACFRAGGHTGRKPTCFYGLGVIAPVRHRPVPSFVQRPVFAAHDRGLTRRHFILFATKANLLPAGVTSPAPGSSPGLHEGIDVPRSREGVDPYPAVF